MWFFQPVVNACLQILLSIAAGYILTKYRIIATADFVPQTSALVLYCCFPCLNVYYLGIMTDLSQRENWLVLSASIAWTLLSQLAILVSVFLVNSNMLLRWFEGPHDAPSDLFTGRIRAAGFVNLALTSDNTVLVGLPLVTAVFGATGAKASLLTMFPIFLLAIPFSIVAFEWERARTCNMSERSESRIEEVPAAESSMGSTTRLVEPKSKMQGFVILKKILLNPVVWSLVLSILISVSTIGPRYLNPESSSYVTELGWIASTTRTIASVAVPLSLISQGSWMHSKPLSFKTNDSQIGPLLFFLLLRSICLPFLQLVVARFMIPGLDAESGMSLVLLTVCPIASSCFVIATQYSRGQSIISSLTVLGTLLLLPLSLMILYLPRVMGIWEYKIGVQ